MRSAYFIGLTLMLSQASSGIYLNQTKHESSEKNPAFWTEIRDDAQKGIWGQILEEWALTSNNYREKRVIHFNSPLMLTVKRNDNDNFIPIDAPVTQPTEAKESKIAASGHVASLYSFKPTIPSKIVNSGVSSTTIKAPNRQVTETDLYLLGAIEKLVFRVDFMEKRLRRVEEAMYFMMAGNRIDTAQCPDNFTRVGHNCYYFAYAAGRELDWKAASKHCMKMSASLVEMESIEENQQIVAFIQTNPKLRGKDFWTSGLNPGLLWIWSGSARPVAATDKNHKPTMQISGDGRCLRLAADHSKGHYTYLGTDCSVRYNYICEQPDTTSSNEVRRWGKMRDIFTNEHSL